MSRSAAGYGSGFSRTASTTVKSAVFAPMPRARTASAIVVIARGGRAGWQARFIRYAGLRPRVQSSGKGLVHHLLGKIEIAEQADQSSQDSSRIHAINGVEQFAYLLSGTL